MEKNPLFYSLAHFNPFAWSEALMYGMDPDWPAARMRRVYSEESYREFSRAVAAGEV